MTRLTFIIAALVAFAAGVGLGLLVGPTLGTVAILLAGVVFVAGMLIDRLQ